MFFLVFTTVALLFSGYITWRLFGRSRFGRAWKWLIAAGIAAVFLLTPLNIMLRRAGYESGALDVLVWASYLGLGFVSALFTFVVIRDAIWVPLTGFRWLARRIGPKDVSAPDSGLPEDYGRRRFITAGVNTGILAASAVFTGVGLAEARQIPDLKEVVIPVEGLSPDLEGFRIVQITDIHVSPTIKRPFVESVVERVNRLDGDIVALTGDLVDGSVSWLSNDVAPLSRVRSKLGNYFVTGNHEYYSGAEVWVEKVRRLGFEVLMNEHRVLTRGRGRIVLAGVTDYRAGNFFESHRSDPAKAIAGAPRADVKLLLAHQPKSVFKAAEAGFDIQISGHTHGGQFFPWNLLVGIDQPFVAGLYTYKSTHIYVSRGTGYWGPPLRFGSPSEITLIRLTRRR